VSDGLRAKSKVKLNNHRLPGGGLGSRLKARPDG
jgi:hypothetical protein